MDLVEVLAIRREVEEFHGKISFSLKAPFNARHLIMTMTDDELDGLADRWHAMATLERQALEEAYGAEAVALLQSFVSEVAGQEIIPTPHNANEFADMVVLLRDGEKRWSKRLGDVIIRASQASAGGKVEDAVALLSAFIVACPWRSFRDMADIERWEYF